MCSQTITSDAVGRSEVPPEPATVEARIVGDGDTLSDARAITSDRTATL